jgi:hypothetical protein
VGKGSSGDRMDRSRVCPGHQSDYKASAVIYGQGGGNVPVGIKDGFTASLTGHWLIHDWRQIFSLLEWSVESRDGYNGSCSLDPTGWPSIPRETDSCSCQLQSSLLRLLERLTISVLDILKV